MATIESSSPIDTSMVVRTGEKNWSAQIKPAVQKNEDKRREEGLAPSCHIRDAILSVLSR